MSTNEMVRGLLSNIHDSVDNGSLRKMRELANNVRHMMSADDWILVDDALKEGFVRVANSTLTGRETL